MTGRIIRRISYLFRLSRYATSLPGSVSLVYSYIYGWLEPKLGLPPRVRPVRLRLLGQEVTLCLGRFSDFCVFEEVFVKEEYCEAADPGTHPVVDVGANIGLTAIYFALRFPHARIYALEPDPATFKHLSDNVRAFSNIIPEHAGLGDMVGTVTFYVYPGSSISSSFIQRTSASMPIPVPMHTLASWCQARAIERIGLLKFDIEGYEDRLFAGMEDPGAIDQYIGELHFDLMDKDAEWFMEHVPEHIAVSVPVTRSRSIFYAKRI